MRSVGLDWAVDPGDRAAVILQKDTNGPIKVIEITSPVSVDDATVRCTAGENDVVAVDIPFAWPKQFREFVSKWIPFAGPATKPPDSDTFRYRTTDLFVHEKTKKWPLSVSSNLFALGARQWAEVVHRGRLDHNIVVSKVSLPQKRKPYIIEVYPAATLRVFKNQGQLLISGESTQIVEEGMKVKETKPFYKSDETTSKSC